MKDFRRFKDLVVEDWSRWDGHRLWNRERTRTT